MTTSPLLLLDLDGPILDVSRRYFAAHRRALDAIGDPGQPLGLTAFWQAKRERRPNAALLVEPARAPEYLDAFRAAVEDESLLGLDELQPGALQAIVQLSEHFKVQVLSMRSNVEGAGREVHRLGITALAPALFVPHLAGSKVPAAKTFAAERRVEVVVGDSEADAEVARVLAASFLGVENGIRTGRFLLSVGAQEVHPSLASLSAQLCR